MPQEYDEAAPADEEQIVQPAGSISEPLHNPATPREDSPHQPLILTQNIQHWLDKIEPATDAEIKQAQPGAPSPLEKVGK